MAENTNDSAVQATEEELTSYTTETNAGAGTGTSAIAPGYGTGRRKEAVARVRLVPGTGKLNHQQAHPGGVLPLQAAAA